MKKLATRQRRQTQSGPCVHECISKSTARTPGYYNCIICVRTQISPKNHYGIHRIHKSSLPLLQFCLRFKTKLASFNNTSGHMTLPYFLSLPKSKCGALQIPGKSEGSTYFKLFLHDKSMTKVLWCTWTIKVHRAESFFDMFSESSQKGEQQRATKQATNSGALKGVGIFFLFKQCFR